MSLDRLAAALSDRYRLERELGQGGMATVYLAHDLKHDRKVAIKVLKPDLAAVLGAERFITEIKTTAALSHPHILPLFDSGEAYGPDKSGPYLFYVMPYLDGETIREKLTREGQFGIGEAVKIATEVAEALDYAHQHGVIHRDIKPENILLHAGRPMVMDFGIALAVSAAAGGRMTETGLSLGTPHYMSPEQATADKQITARSDIYSLASVLFEMLAGEPPHGGGSAQAIIMKIVTDTPRPVTELRKSVPPNVAAALAKALEKVPADRFATAREFADALVNPLFTTGSAAAASARADSVMVLGRAVSWRAVAAGLAGVSVALAVWALSRGNDADTGGLVTRAEVAILTRSDSGVWVSGLDVSPDGSMIVYAADSGGTVQLYLRRIDERTAHPIPGTEDGTYPAFSPDGSSIAFAQGSAIRRIPVGGAVVEHVVQTDEGSWLRDLRWASDGHIYYGERGVGDGVLSRVLEEGGAPQVVLKANTSGTLDPLPGGTHVLYTECCGPGADVRVVDLQTGDTRSLGVNADFARYLPTGHLLLVSDDALRVVGFDARRLTVSGQLRSVLDSVSANGSISDFATSRNGTVAYTVRPRTGGSSSDAQPVLVDMAGNTRRISLPAAFYWQIRFAPDGRRIAYASAPVDRGPVYKLGVRVHDLVLGTTVNFWSDTAEHQMSPVWSSDGQSLFYTTSRDRGSTGFLISRPADGTGAPDTLLRYTDAQAYSSGIQVPLAVSPDGRRALLQGRTGGDPSRDWDLLVASVDSLASPTPYLVADWNEVNGRISPDGRWVAYESDEEGTRRIYVRSFPEPGQRYDVSDTTGFEPRWAPDGRTIYYVRRGTLVAATVTTSPAFRVTGRRDLFALQQPSAYDVSPDGNQFVTVHSAASSADPQAAVEPYRLVLVTNWFEELRRKLGEQR